MIRFIAMKEFNRDFKFKFKFDLEFWETNWTRVTRQKNAEDSRKQCKWFSEILSQT